MPKVTLHGNGQWREQEVAEGSNLVVLAATRRFANLKYGCGMGKCTKCTVRVLSGADGLPEPNWKERKLLGDRLELGYRLACQLVITRDIELLQE